MDFFASSFAPIFQNLFDNFEKCGLIQIPDIIQHNFSI